MVDNNHTWHENSLSFTKIDWFSIFVVCQRFSFVSFCQLVLSFKQFLALTLVFTFLFFFSVYLFRVLLPCLVSQSLGLSLCSFLFTFAAHFSSFLFFFFCPFILVNDSGKASETEAQTRLNLTVSWFEKGLAFILVSGLL